MQKILIVENEPRLLEYLPAVLQSSSYLLEFVEDGAQALDYLAQEADEVALVIIDMGPNGKQDHEAVREIHENYADLPVILLSGPSGQFATGLSGRKQDLLELRREVDTLVGAPVEHEMVDRAEPVPSPLAGSAWGRKVELILSQIGDSDIPVLVQGETGVGKEVLARQIHDQSLRRGKTFLKLNCAALPSELVESELFGFERGAFTGAYKSNPGRFEMAHGGTILLDEIGDMDFRLQAKLLHVLQDHEFTRIGARHSSRVDVRVIAATHCNLERAIVEKRFREDLYYRLNVITLVVPPLRERASEVLALAQFLLKKHATGNNPIPEIGSALERALLEYEWPGNIRELENVMRKYLLLRNSLQIIEELHTKAQRRGSGMPVFKDNAAEPISIAPDSHRSLKQVDEARKKAEADTILRALEATSWNRKKSAVLLNTDYKAFLYKMKKLGIGERIAMTAS